MTNAERAHLDKVARLGCVVCRNQGLGETPACLHHIREGQGGAMRASHYEVIPLCPHHHQHGGHGEAIHAGQETWEARFGTESELLAQTLQEVGR
jgi:hypothetical protein